MNRTLPLLLALFPLLAGCQPSGRVSNLVALFTDFGSSDPYVAQLKGAIKTISPSAEIMDLSHENGAFDILSASYLLAKSARTLPPGTIIVAVVDPGVGSNRAALAVRTQAGHIYLAPDNGPKAEKILRLPRNTATVMANLAKGQILYIDSYGNILTNIPGSELGKLKVGQLLSVTIKGKATSLPFLRTYADAPANRPFALINSDGEFEIAINQGHAARELGVKVGDPVALKL